MSEVKPSREALTRREESFPPLLPLPETFISGQPCYFGTQMQDYARANMEPLLAENERLRVEAARLRRSLNEAIIHGNRQSGRAEWMVEALWVVVELDEEDGDSLHNARAIARAALDQEDRKEDD